MEINPGRGDLDTSFVPARRVDEEATPHGGLPMTVMINRIKNVLTTPLFASRVEVGDEAGVWVTRWTESRRLPPPLPTFEDAELEGLFDGVFASAA